MLMAVNAACVSFRAPPAPLPATEAARAPGAAWRATLGRRALGTPVTDGATLWFAGVDRFAYALDLASGRLRWKQRLLGPPVSGLLRAGGTLFVATARPEGTVAALDAETGRPRWRVKTLEAAGPMALLGRTLLIPTRDGTLLGVDTAQGRIRWRHPAGVVRAAPLVLGTDAALVATADSLFLVGEDGRVRFARRAPGALLAPPVRAGDLLVGGTTDSLVVALRVADLAEAWRHHVDAPVTRLVAVAGDTAWAVSRIGTVYRLGLDGAAPPVAMATLRWPASTGPVPFGGLLLVGGADGVLRALDAAGVEHWRVQQWRPIAAEPLAVGSDLVVFGGNGDIVRYHQEP